jgi:SAM-dependent methyltransferase
VNELEHRHSVEQAWHDKKVARKKGIQPDFYAMGALDLANAYMQDALGDVLGKTVVDFGCGEGRNAIRLAQQGAMLFAFDISSAMVERARKNILDANLQRQVFINHMAAEHLAYPDGFADLVYGHSILHHTDLALTRAEVHRILRPHGRAVFLEPLAHNPFLRFFRRLTSSRRTATERPLRFADARFFSEPFASFDHREFYLLALSAFACVPLRSKRCFAALLRILGRADEALLTMRPGLGRYAWVTVMELVK